MPFNNVLRKIFRRVTRKMQKPLRTTDYTDFQDMANERSRRKPRRRRNDFVSSGRLGWRLAQKSYNWTPLLACAYVGQGDLPRALCIRVIRVVPRHLFPLPISVISVQFVVN